MIEIDSFDTSDVVVYTDEGYPTGSEIEHYLAFTPSIHAIEPAVGNSGGTWITVQGSGFGTGSSDLTLIDADGKDLCQEAYVLEYGLFQCLTIEEDIVEGTTFDFSIGGAA